MSSSWASFLIRLPCYVDTQVGPMGVLATTQQKSPRLLPRGLELGECTERSQPKESMGELETLFHPAHYATF